METTVFNLGSGVAVTTRINSKSSPTTAPSSLHSFTQNIPSLILNISFEKYLNYLGNCLFYTINIYIEKHHGVPY
jgi:hypothetical protein